MYSAASKLILVFVERLAILTFFLSFTGVFLRENGMNVIKEPLKRLTKDLKSTNYYFNP